MDGRSRQFNPDRIAIDGYAIVPHASEPRLLLLKGEGGWSLPQFVPKDSHAGNVREIGPTLKDRLGIDAIVLDCWCNEFNRTTGAIERVYTVRNGNPDWQLPAHGRWIDRQELRDCPLAHPQHRRWLQQWFDCVGDGTVPAQPWAHPDWFDRPRHWIETQLECLGIEAIAPFEQLKAWPLATTWCIPTTWGNLYFKAVAPLFALEPQHTLFLAKSYPDRLPRVLAIEPQQHWLLMGEAEGDPLACVRDLDRWGEALEAFARLQIDSIPRVDEFLANDVPDLRLDRLDRFLVALPEFWSNWDVAGSMAVLKLVPRLRQVAREFARSGIPPTLVHGDLSPLNIYIGDRAFTYTDWSDSCITHPFFDLARFLYEIELDFPDSVAARSRLRDAYLQPWTDYAPMSQCVAAFEQAYQTLATLYEAIVRHQLAPHWRFEVAQVAEPTAPFYLKRLLVQVSAYLNLSLRGLDSS